MGAPPSTPRPEIKELERKIKLILDHSDTFPMFFQTKNAPPFLPQGQLITGTPKDVINDSGVLCRSEGGDALKALYASVPTLQGIFLPLVIGNATEQSASLVANLIVDLGFVDQLGTLRKQAGFPWNSILSALNMRLRFMPQSFSDDDLHVLERFGTIGTYNKAMGGSSPYKPLLEAVERVRYFRLRDELLQRANPEINADQRTVIERSAQLEFDPKLQQALFEIDKKMASAASEFDFKGCMDLIRTALEEYVEESAKKIEKKAGVSLPTGGVTWDSLSTT